MRFEFGIEATWRGKRIGVETGFSRSDLFPLHDNFGYSRHVEYNYPLAIRYHLSKVKQLGLEYTYLNRHYIGSTNGFRNNDGEGMDIIGTFDWLVTSRMRLEAAAGISRKYFDNSGTAPDTTDRDTLFYSLTLNHQANRKFKHRASIIRSSQFSLVSNVSETTAIQYSFDWRFIRDIVMSGGVGYLTADDSGPLGQTNDRHTANLGFLYNPTKKSSVRFDYYYMINSSNVNPEDFTQNRFRIGYTYDF